MTTIIITFYVLAILFLIGSCKVASRADAAAERAEHPLIQNIHSPDLPTAGSTGNGDDDACTKVAQ